jgi:molybdopterin-guanine dinucleotide biosynthesis protein A
VSGCEWAGEDLVCAILAGGQSRRMGSPKSLIEIGGRPILGRIIDQAREVTGRICICADNQPRYLPLGLPVIQDIHKDQGPLAGLHAAMTCYRGSPVLLLACDLPRVHAQMLRRLAELSRGYDITVPKSSAGDIQPLCGIYRPACFTVLEQCLRQRLNKVLTLHADPSLRVRHVGPQEGHFADRDLININTPEDLDLLIDSPSPPHM